MRVNRDAEVGSIVARYGVTIRETLRHRPSPEKMMPLRKKTTSTKRPKKNRKVKIKQKQRAWIDIHREHLRWKKTPGYLKWRRTQFLRQGGTCYYCDEPLNGTVINDEHIIPKSMGGGNGKDNLVLACWRCNKVKGSNMLSRAERERLRLKNKQKKGTYHLIQEHYKSEEDLAVWFSQIF